MNSEDDFAPIETDSSHQTDDNYFDVDDDDRDDQSPGTDFDAATTDPDDRREIDAARAAFDDSPRDAPNSADEVRPTPELAEEDPRLVELAQPFVGRWNRLISTTNWDKGRIISQWRQALIEQDAAPTQYSDEAWVRRVGGVTSPHVGRLRRVFDRFGETYESYDGLYWSHFLAALDWDDAPLWLEGAARESWSVSAMREHRWQAHGAVDSQRPTNSQIVDVDLDEDVVLPAQGGRSDRQYDDQTDGIHAGPVPEEPDFGDGEELSTMDDGNQRSGTQTVEETDQNSATPVQPFVGLPKLPEDLADALEAFKLAVLRHKSAEWKDVDAETLRRYLDALKVLLTSG